MLVLYKSWKKYNEFKLTTNKMDLNTRKMTNHPPSHVHNPPSHPPSHVHNPPSHPPSHVHNQMEEIENN